MSGGPKQTLKEGFEKFVIKNPNGCWDWKGCCPKNPGYGQFRYGMKRERSHRASWIIHFGKIPKGMFVLHKCDNKRCSNPDHLFLGNNLDNIKDCLNKGRHPTIGKSGEQNPKAKLTIEKVKQIRKLLENGFSQYKIANQFHVGKMTICRIKNNITWKGIQ